MNRPDNIQLSLSHLGYLPSSPKMLTLVCGEGTDLPDRIPYYIRQNCFRMPRDARQPAGFSARFPCPFDPLRGRLVPEKGTFFHRGELRRIKSRWGTFWQSDFSNFQQVGSYQIETDYQVSVPFMIAEDIYDRLIRGYLTFLHSERCGSAVYGVHPACHLDDGVLDRDGSAWPVTGGWHDAGDFRKWMAFILFHLEALVTIQERVKPPLPKLEGGHADPILDEIAWGNRFFHGMITRDGQVFEDVAGGSAPPGSPLTFEKDWWFENHPGCFGDATDNRWTDNRPGSGDERMVRTTYNPFIQFAFVHVQSRVSGVLPGREGRRCLALAERAWRYGLRRPHDNRTLFLAAQLRAALELIAAGSKVVTWDEAIELARQLMTRQEVGRQKLSGYFLEANGADGFRSFAFSDAPCMALLRLCELRRFIPRRHKPFTTKVGNAVRRFIEDYLLADAKSNPFGLVPYGVYLHPPHRDQQVFRPAGKGRGVRTFVHPFSSMGIVHGAGGVLMSHAHLLARAGTEFSRPEWRQAAERLLHWSLGHNTTNRSLFTGIGYRQPVGYSFRIAQLPEALIVGFIGRPDDTPYLEESTAIEWNTLEYWSIPYLHAACAISFLREEIK